MKNRSIKKRIIGFVLCMGLVLPALPLSSALAEEGAAPQQAQAAPAAATNAENYMSPEAYQAFGLGAVNNAAAQPKDFTENVADPLADYTPMELSELYVASMNRSNAYSGDAKVLKGPDTFSSGNIKLDNMKKESSHSYSSGIKYQAQNATAVSYARSTDPDATEGIAESVLYTSGGRSYQKITLYDSQMKELDSLEIPISDQYSGDWVKGIEADSARGLTAIEAGGYYLGIPCIAAYVPARVTTKGREGSPYIMIATVDAKTIEVQQKIYLYDVRPDTFGNLGYYGWFLPVVDLHTTSIAGYDDLVINACLPFSDLYADRDQTAASVIYSYTNEKAVGRGNYTMGRLFNIPMSYFASCTRFAAACDADLNGNGVGELVVASHRNKRSGSGKGTMVDNANAVQIVTWDPKKEEYQYVWQYAGDVNKIQSIYVNKEVTEPVAVTAGRYFAGDNKDYLFLEGITFKFKDAFPSSAQTEADYFKNNSLVETSRITLGGQRNLFVSNAVTACFARDRYGTEQTAVVSGAIEALANYRIDYDVSWVHGTGLPGSTTLTHTRSDTGYITNKGENYDGTFLTITGVDVDKDTVYFKYKGKQSGWSAPTPVVVMPATPHYEEMLYMDGYDAGSVSFTMSSSQGKAVDRGWTVGGGINVGLQIEGGVGVAGEQIMVGGVFEDELLLSAIQSRYRSQNISTSVSYESDGDEANVVCVASPVTSYLYDVWIPEYTVTAETRAEYKKQMGEDCPFAEGSTQGGTFETYSVNNIYNPQYSILSVDQYNQAAQNYGTSAAPVKEIDMKAVYADYVPGAPDTYPKAQADLQNVAKDSYHAGSPHMVSTNATQGFSAGYDQTTEYSNGFSLDFSASLNFITEAKVSMIAKVDVIAQAGGNFELAGEATWINSAMKGEAVGATITKLPSKADAYGFSATPALWRTTALTGKDDDGGNPYVFGFLADGAGGAPPTVPDMWVYDTQLEAPDPTGTQTSYITLCWDDEDGTRPAARYEVFQVAGNTVIPVGTTDKNDKNNMLTVKGLQSGQQYTFQLRATGAGGANPSILGRPLKAASQPKDPPIITRQPKNVNSGVGNWVEFTVEAQPGKTGGTLYYQWQRFVFSPNSLLGSWKNLTEYPEAGKTTYKVDPLVARDDNAKFRVVVYETPTVGGICPMAYSSEAVLSVGPSSNPGNLQISPGAPLEDYYAGYDKSISFGDDTSNYKIYVTGLLNDVFVDQCLYLLFVDEAGTVRMQPQKLNTADGNAEIPYDPAGLFSPGPSGQPALQEGRIQVYAVYTGEYDQQKENPQDQSSADVTDVYAIERMQIFLQTGNDGVLQKPLQTTSAAAQAQAPEPTGTPAPEPTETPLPTATPEPTETPMPAETPTPEPTATPTATETPVQTDLPETAGQVAPAGQSPVADTPAPTETPTPESTSAPTATPEPTAAPAATPEPEASTGPAENPDTLQGGMVPFANRANPPCYATTTINYHAVDEDSNSVEVSFETGRGDNSPHNIERVTRATPVFDLFPAEVDGGKFLGWYADAGHTTSVDSIGPVPLTTLHPVLHAAYEDTVYNITYHLDGGTNDPLNPGSYTIVSPSFGLREPEKAGYRFTGWFTDEGLTSPIASVAHGSMGDIDLYAGWEIINYSIYYTAGDGSVPDGSPQTYTVLDAVSPGPPQYGSGSGTWYTDSMFAKAFSGQPAGSTGTLVLYGKEPDRPDTPSPTPTPDTPTPSVPPNQPSQPDQPGQPGQPGQPNSGQSAGGGPKTGDDTLIWPFILIAICAGAVIAIVVWRKRRMNTR